MLNWRSSCWNTDSCVLSITHGKEIQRNPQFRAEFARMCNAIGVDPLSSSYHKDADRKSSPDNSGSIWARFLGDSVNDFYFGLAVRIVEVCRETRSENGGMIALEEVCTRIQRGNLDVDGRRSSRTAIDRAFSQLKLCSNSVTVTHPIT